LELLLDPFDALEPPSSVLGLVVLGSVALGLVVVGLVGVEPLLDVRRSFAASIVLCAAKTVKVPVNAAAPAASQRVPLRTLRRPRLRRVPLIRVPLIRFLGSFCMSTILDREPENAPRRPPRLRKIRRTQGRRR
jgi:hypothetical protein